MRLASLFFALTAGLLTVTACSSSSQGSGEETAQQTVKTDFSADSAMVEISRQVEMGPRVPDTDINFRCGEYLASQLRRMGAEVVVGDTVIKNVEAQSCRVRNILGRFNSEASRRVLLVAHYDTRPWADKDPEVANHTRAIDGANDGASGVAVILEVMRHRSLFSGLGVDVLFVDNEDSGSYSGEDDTWCLGSQLYASTLPAGAVRPIYGLLLDMVGDSGARFPKEYFSNAYAPAVVDMVWRNARATGHSDRFINADGGAINDDHVPLLMAGIPCIDIIDIANDATQTFAPTWHTMADNISNIDPTTIKAVGDVVLYTLIQSSK
jgi:hypothetical protein